MQKKNGSRKNRKNGTVATPLNKELGMPAVVKRTLHSAKFLNITHDAEYTMYLNDAVDPMGTGGTNQPYYFDQMAALYTRCFVEKTRYKITVLGNNTISEVDFVAVPNLESASLAASPLDELAVRPRAQNFVLPSQDLASNIVRSPFVTDVIPTKEFVEYKNWQDAEDLQCLTTDDTGLRTLYLHLVNKNGAYTLILFVEFWQDIYFFGRKMVAPS